MKLTIELEREVDGRWIAEVPELNILLYGDSRQDAIQRAQVAAQEIVLTGSPAQNYLPIHPMPPSTLLREHVAFG